MSRPDPARGRIRRTCYRVAVTVTSRILPVVVLAILLAVAHPPVSTAQGIVLDDLRAAATELPELRSLLVIWRGQAIGEYYRAGVRPGSLANVKSASKSVISTLVGIAIERRLIPTVDQPIATYFPELAKDPDPRKRSITIEDLLTMRSGLESTSGANYGGWVKSANWVRFALRQPIVSEPGTAMKYSTGSSHLLSAILTKVSRKSTLLFAQETLATPLGFRLASWLRDPQGIYFGGNEMLLTPTQMAAIGELYESRTLQGPPNRSVGLGRYVLCAADDLRMGWRPALRIWMVDPDVRATHGLLRVGIRRPVHLRFSRPQPRPGRDVVDNGQRRAARPSPPVVRFDRATRAHAGVCGHGAGQLKMRLVRVERLTP